MTCQLLLLGVPLEVKMSYGTGLGAKQALKEHVLAVSRDFISQPRLSKYFEWFNKIYFLNFNNLLCLKMGGYPPYQFGLALLRFLFSVCFGGFSLKLVFWSIFNHYINLNQFGLEPCSLEMALTKLTPYLGPA